MSQALRFIFNTFQSAFGDDMWTENTFRKIFEQSQCIAYKNRAILYRIITSETEILSIAVDPQHQGQGVGRQLVEEMLSKVKSSDKIFLEVAVDNISAMGLYNRCGFSVVGKREKYYKTIRRKN